MAAGDDSKIQAGMLSFALKQGQQSHIGARLGELIVRNRGSIFTPNYVVPTSRGVVPHVTQDTQSKLTGIGAIYIGLEDFIERTAQQAPILRQPNNASSSKLRDFVGLPDKCISILGPRRVPAIECPNHNANASISVCTSVGFQSLALDDYLQNTGQLGSDITVSIADVVTAKQASQKRLEKSADRTHAWMRDTLQARPESEAADALFASIPPLEAHQQSFYLSDLCEDYLGQVGGLTLYSPDTATVLPKELEQLPRLCLTSPETPHEILRAVFLGNDLITVPLVTDTSESGIAFTFSLDTPGEGQHVPLGLDLWDPCHAIDVSPLVEGCQCYTCTTHHRAYLHHLLSVKEMLAWTLLQIHNFHVMTNFFEHIRTSIEDGTFEEKSKAFGQRYALELPKATGQGPRIRGYQTKSVGGGEAKKNKKAYGRLDDQLMKLQEAESGIATPEVGTDAQELEKHGLGAPHG